MRFFRQLLLRINGCLEGERFLSHCRQHHAVIGKACVITVIVAAVLLRADVIFLLFCRCAVENAVIACLVLIHVALHRAEAAVGQFCKRFRQEQAQAKTRQNREYRVFLCFYMDIGRSVAVNCPFDHTCKNPLQSRRRNRIACLDLHAAVFFFCRCLIRPRHGAVILRTHPGILDIAVIVCRRTPDVQLHRAVE